MTEAAPERVHDALAAAIAAEGIDTVFGVIGGVTDRVVLHLVERHGVRYIPARHEQGAIVMADAYSRASGRVGLAAISMGPGLTNAATGLTAARHSRSQLVVVTSDKPQGSRLGNMDIDQAPIVHATAGALQEISGPAALADQVHLAFRHVRLRRGPIVISVPFNLADLPMPEGWTYRSSLEGSAGPQSPQPDPAEVARVADMIRASARPLVLAGRGAVTAGARDDLVALADRAGAVLGTTLLAKGWFRGHPFDVGLVGGFAPEEARAIIAEADLVLAFGAHLSQYTLDQGRAFGPAARIVHVDIDPQRVGEIAAVDSAVVADAAATARALLGALGDEPRPGWRSSELAARIEDIDPWRGVPFRHDEGYIDRHLLVRMCDELLPRQRQLVVGIGHFMGVPAAQLSIPDPRDITLPWRLGAIGSGLTAGIGAAVARPDRLTVVFEGDGGLMMTVAELETAARCRIPMVVICEDDGGYGAERLGFKARRENVMLSNFANPDFAEVARAFGCRAYSVSDAAQLEQVLTGLGEIDGPVFINARIHPDDLDTRMARGHLPPGRAPLRL